MTSYGNPINERFRQVFSFSKDDLEANRLGQITPQQQSVLREKKDRQFMRVMAMIGIAVVAFVILATNPGKSSKVPPGLCTLCLALPCLAGLTLIPALYKWGLLHDDLRDLRMASLQGPVKRRISTRRRNGVRFYLTINNQTFELDQHQYGAFAEDQEYIIYYGVASRTIISAEHAASISPHFGEAFPPIAQEQAE